MAKKATKAASNIFYIARMEAATCNGKLKSREGAGEATGIDRTRLARIELGSLSPYPEEVLILSDTYNTPELINYFCSKMCPLGCRMIPNAEMLELDRLAIKILSSMNNASFIQKAMLEIAEDGRLTKNEEPQLELILNHLENITKTTVELKLFLEKKKQRMNYETV